MITLFNIHDFNELFHIKNLKKPIISTDPFQ